MYLDFLSDVPVTVHAPGSTSTASRAPRRYRAAAAPQPPPDPTTRPAPRQLSETERAARLLFPDEFSSEDEADEGAGEGAANGHLPTPQQNR